MSWIKKATVFLCILLIALCTVGFCFEQYSRYEVNRSNELKGRLFEIDSNQVHLHCIGQGSPTIVLEAGLDMLGSASWAPVHSILGQHTKTCAYDRPSILWSSGEPTSDGRQAAELLRATLSKANVAPPFLFVGHSGGAIYARHFVEAYEREIAGVMLIDGTHPEQFSRMPEEVAETLIPPPHALVLIVSETGIVRLLAPSLKESRPESVRYSLDYAPLSVHGLFGEMVHAFDVAHSSRSIKSFHDIPLTVLTRGREPVLPDSTPEELQKEIREVWSVLQQELAELSTNAKHVVVPNASHYIHHDAPEVVIVELLELIGRTSTATPIGRASSEM